MRLAFILILSLTVRASYGQIKISGEVRAEKTKPLPGASISISGSYDGTTSDTLGHFEFNTSEKGSHILVISATGYQKIEDSIHLGEENIKKHYILKQLARQLDAVVISAGTFEAGDKNRSTVLSSLDIVTTASANGDITNALKTLPGTQQVGEQEGLFVRGGTSKETKFFIDGTLVNNFFYSSEPGKATRGRFNPFLFQGTLFSTGGYSALYGQALSSVVLLESVDLPDRTSGNMGISYLSVNGGIQKLAKNKKSSWGATYAYANPGLAFSLIPQKEDYFNMPQIHSLDANFRFRTKSGGMVKYYGTFTHTTLGFRFTDIDSLSLKDAFSISNGNMYHNLSYKQRFGNQWRLQTGASYSTNKDKIGMELQDDQNKKLAIPSSPLYNNKNFSLKNTGHYVNAKWVLQKGLGGLSAIRFGNEYNYNDDISDYTTDDAQTFSQRIKENLFSTFAEADIYVTNDLAAKLGVRSEHSQLFHQWDFAPRVSFAYKFRSKEQISFAYGQFFQSPDNAYLPSIDKLHFQKATHYILQYQKMAHQRIFRVEAYYKKYKDLIKADEHLGKLTAINNKGFGDAKGIDIFWRDKRSITNVDYWISYSYLDTHRDFLNYPRALVPSFAAKHTASLVVKYFAAQMKTQLNASYTFATGRPYYDLQYDDAHDDYYMAQQGHTRDYNDLSLSINYLPNLGKTGAKSFDVWVLSLTNVLGANNIYNYTFSANGQHKQAVRPPAKRFLYLGYFLSFGIDRTQNAIDNNL